MWWIGHQRFSFSSLSKLFFFLYSSCLSTFLLRTAADWTGGRFVTSSYEWERFLVHQLLLSLKAAPWRSGYWVSRLAPTRLDLSGVFNKINETRLLLSIFFFFSYPPLSFVLYILFLGRNQVQRSYFYTLAPLLPKVIKVLLDWYGRLDGRECRFIKGDWTCRISHLIIDFYQM